MSQAERIGIVIPTYNRLGFFKRALRSALTQSYPNLRVYVVDDGSTDGTWEHLLQIQDDRLTVFRNEKNLGPMLNLRRCVDVLDFDVTWVNILADDDFLAPDFVETVVGRLRMSDKSDVALGQILFVNANDETISQGRMLPGRETGPLDFLKARAHFRIDSYTAAALFRKEAILRVGGYPSIPTGIGGDDYLIYRLGKQGGISLVPAAKCFIRKHPGSYSLDENIYLKHAYSLRTYYEMMLNAIEQDSGSVRQEKDAKRYLRRHVICTLKELMRKIDYKTSLHVASFYKDSGLPVLRAIHIRNRLVRLVERMLGQKAALALARALGK